MFKLSDANSKVSFTAYITTALETSVGSPNLRTGIVEATARPKSSALRSSRSSFPIHVLKEQLVFLATI